MSLINITNLTFAHEGSFDNVFQGVSFQLDTQWKLGLTGRNAKGKTTFLHLLMGKYEYGGTISTTTTFQYFPYEVEDETLLTMEVMDNILGDYQQWQLMREFNLLDLNLDVCYRPFATLSGGEKTKVLLGALFLKENSYLLIDEPTNHLDMEGRQVLGKYLQGKSGFILVSHDREFLDSCIDHILVINKMDIQLQRGTFSSWFVNKQRQDNFELMENQKLKKDIKRLEQAAKQASNWSGSLEETKYARKNGGIKPPDRGYIGSKAAKMMQHSKNIKARKDIALEEKNQLLKNIDLSAELKITPLKYHKEILVQGQNLTATYGAKPVLNALDFTIARGEKVAVLGSNGKGKSTLLKLILGEDIKHTGKLYVGAGLEISYVMQNTQDLKGSLKTFAKNENIDESLFKAILRKLDFSRTQFEKDISALSQGQKKKVLIAKSLCSNSHLYLWDEPLNYIDIISRMQILQLLKECEATMVFVEHDSAFVKGIASKSICL